MGYEHVILMLARRRAITRRSSYETLTFYSFIALYNYKPQKDDEIELKKGSLYTVSEKCQDGWFKGQCMKEGKTGVFPGNYVQTVPLK